MVYNTKTLTQYCQPGVFEWPYLGQFLEKNIDEVGNSHDSETDYKCTNKY